MVPVVLSVKGWGHDSTEHTRICPLPPQDSPDPTWGGGRQEYVFEDCFSPRPPLFGSMVSFSEVWSLRVVFGSEMLPL